MWMCRFVIAGCHMASWSTANVPTMQQAAGLSVAAVSHHLGELWDVVTSDQ